MDGVAWRRARPLRALAGRRPGGRDLVDGLEDPLPDALGRDAEIGEDLGAFALALRQDAEQQMLGSDLAAQPHQRLPPRRDYRPAGPWCEPVQRPKLISQLAKPL
jgi:hypothetical protein